jgi:hypothetical protein
MPQRARHEWGTDGAGFVAGSTGRTDADIHARLCPLCQQGKAGEVLREDALGLFG